MSDLASASAATGVPEELLQRAADARAEAMGVSADELLSSWGGGAPAPVGTTPAPSPEPAPEPIQAPASDSEPVAAADPVEEVAAQPAAVAVAVAADTRDLPLQ